MIQITANAAKQILKSFKEGDSSILDSSVLRVAVQQKPDGDFHYLMGLDEAKPEDISYMVNEVKVAIAEEHVALMDKMEIDYVEINPGEYNFIFKNPNDPKYKKANA